jgi:serine/threonine protein kinase
VGSAQDLIAGRYRLVRRIGSGGMGVVWEARDERLDRPVAVKLLRPSPGLSEDEAQLANRRAMNEARITARLDHPHAVSMFDVVDHEGRPCLIMQFVSSVSLAALIKRLTVLSPEQAAGLGTEVGSALAAAHRLGIVHRDVKPANVLIAEDGTARISDFGISNALDDAVGPTAASVLHGTPAFLAPEVARGERSSFASDVYGLGATLYAAVEGVPPFGTDTNPLELLRRVATGRANAPRVAGALTSPLLAMLDADPAARPTMAQVVQTLVELKDQDATPVRSVAALPAPARAPRPDLAAATSPSTGSGSGWPTESADGWPASGESAMAVRRLGASSTRRSRAAGPAIAVAALLSIVILAVTLLPVLSRGVASVLREAARDQPPVYASSTFAVPFEVASPSWLAPRPEVDRPALVTWQAPEVAVRFLVPASVYPPGQRGSAPPPRDYLAYLLGQTDQGARFSDQNITTVGGRPAVIVTATADRRLSGVIGCPERSLAATSCFGLRPERRLRLAVVDVDRATLLIWLRNDREASFPEQSRQFEQLLTTVHFR